MRVARARAVWVKCALCLLLTSACSTPSGNAQRIAGAAGLEQRILEGGRFWHWSAMRTGPSACRRLHVYLDHDGLPWRDRHTVSTDPSPRDPLALRLMALDPGPALYLGRPCHFVGEGSEACQPLTWTHRRYADEVVSSLVRALERHAGFDRVDELVLIGYSGGGTLAMLMAPRLRKTVAVVTIAGNLDTEGWTRLHEYSPLDGSLNPATEPPLSSTIEQMHYVGGRDSNVPPGLTLRAMQGGDRLRIVQIAGFDHRCCWEKVWPEMLARSPLGGAAGCH